MTMTTDLPSDEALRKAIAELMPLLKQGEDNIWRRAKNVIDLLQEALAVPRSSGEELSGAIEPFAKIAALSEFAPSCADDDFYVNLGLMNGNVTQSIIQWKLKVKDFRRLAAMREYSARQTGDGLAAKELWAAANCGLQTLYGLGAVVGPRVSFISGLLEKYREKYQPATPPSAESESK